jgi:hypothetical protein
MRIVIEHSFNELSRKFGNLRRDHASLIVSRSINKVARTVRSKAKSYLIKSSGFKQAYIMPRLKMRLSSPKTLEASIGARDRWSTILRFSPRFGTNDRDTVTVKSAAAWRNRRKYRKTFVITGRGGNALPVYRDRTGRLKTIYGPSMARELGQVNQNASFRKDITKFIDSKLPEETARYFDVYMRQNMGKR